MLVLVACEESQVVTKAFRELGHIAFSIDLRPCSGGHSEWHIQGDAISILTGYDFPFIDLLIAHPPCTYLSAAGSCNFTRHPERYDLQREARDFFMFFYNFQNASHICIENPRPMKSANLPPYSQIIQPYDFGAPFSKQTMLWLKNLPPLFASFAYGNRRSAAPSWTAIHRSSIQRSKTFPEIAQAMALQWSYFIDSKKNF